MHRPWVTCRETWSLPAGELVSDSAARGLDSPGWRFVCRTGRGQGAEGEGEAARSPSETTLRGGGPSGDPPVTNLAPFTVGDDVAKRADRGVHGRITKIRMMGGEWWATVKVGSSQKKIRAEDLVLVDSGAGLEDDLIAGRFGGPDMFRRHVAAIKLHRDRGLTDTILSFGASKTEFHAYQYIPLLKMLEHERRRILIADEVGLGKTIEAAYILQEQLARGGPMDRVLIVCPAALRTKWQRELLERFQLDFEILDLSEACRRVPRRREEELSGRPLRGIVSLQSIRHKRFLDEMQREPAPPFATVVVDEVHHCRNRGTSSHRAVGAVIENADSVVFLSATPVQTQSEDLFHTLNLLVPGEFLTEDVFHARAEVNSHVVRAETLIRDRRPEALSEARETLAAAARSRGGGYLTRDPEYPAVLDDLASDEPDSPVRRVRLQQAISRLNQLSHVFTRTKRRDVKISSAVRSASNHYPAMTPYERKIHDALLNHFFRRYRDLHGSNVAKFVLSTYERYVSSSIVAAVSRFRDACAAEVDELRDLEIDADGFMDEATATALDSSRYIPSQDHELASIVGGADLERLEAEDSKFAMLLDVLDLYFTGKHAAQNPSNKVVIFSFFRGAIEYLDRRLASAGIKLVRIDGSVPSTPNDPDRDERGRRIETFRDDPDVQVLLTSEVGGEGLDFQFCNTVVNWDLPWNPMKVEQRVGRVDRLKQKAERIFVVNIALEGTIEAKIVDRLFARIGLFERTIGELEPILGERMEELQDELFRPHLDDAERSRRIDELTQGLEREREQLRMLEERADELIGHDALFRDELDRIRRFGRFLGGAELRRFVEYELQRRIDGGGLRELGDEAGVFKLSRRAEVSNLVTDSLPKGDRDGMRFRDRLRSREDTFVTFDGELAERSSRRVEPLHAKHPLVRAIASLIDPEEVDREHAVAVHVRIDSSIVQPGEYVFGYALIEESGFMPSRTLAAVAVPVDGDELEPLGPDESNAVLGAILAHGRDVPEVAGLPPTLVHDWLACIDETLASRVSDRARERKQRFASRKARRRLAIEQDMDQRIEASERRVATIRAHREEDPESGDRGLAGFTSMLDELRFQKDDRLRAVDAEVLGDVEYSLLGAGVVIIDGLGSGA